MAPIHDSAVDAPIEYEAAAGLDDLKRRLAGCSDEQKKILFHYMIRLIYPDLDQRQEVPLNDSDNLTYAFVMSSRRWAELVDLPSRFKRESEASGDSPDEEGFLLGDVLDILESSSTSTEFLERQAHLRSAGR